jgi:predicted nucleotidyltransferase component of viral defense system
MEGGNMIDKELLLQIGRKKGLKNREFIEKEYFQDLMLFHIYEISNSFVFKGGTALYKLYNLPRFSEDLDFSVLGEIKNKDIEGVIETAAKKVGMEIKSKKMIKGSLLFKLGFKGILTPYNTLRIDVNLKQKVFEYEVNNYVPEFIDINPFSLKILSLKEMIAEKIHSLLKRTKARDLFDLFFLLRLETPERKIIERKLKIFGMRFDIALIDKKINSVAPIWEKELKPFVLTDIPKFDTVKKFVMEKLSVEMKLF